MKKGNSTLAFVAAAMFLIAGVGECILGFRSRSSFALLGAVFLVSGALWIAVGVKFKRAERQRGV